MYGTSLRLGRRTLLASAAAVTVTVVNLEKDNKLSIYPSPPGEIVLIETPSELEKQIGVARRAVARSYTDAHARVQGVVSKWIGIEHAIENRIKSIISPTEPLTPGILYVGVATLSASILSRNRFLPTRILLPPTFFLVSLNHFLPQTTANLSAYLGSLEDRYFPTLAQKHGVANAHTRMAWERVKDVGESGKERVLEGVGRGVDKVQEVTGLKVRESLGWGRKTKTREEEEEVKASVENKVEKKTDEIEKKRIV